MQLEKACCPCCVGGSHVARSPPYEGYPASTLPYAALTVMAVCVAFACFVLCVVCTARATTILILHCLPMDNASRSQKGSSLLSLSLPLSTTVARTSDRHMAHRTHRTHTHAHTRGRGWISMCGSAPLSPHACALRICGLCCKKRARTENALKPLCYCVEHTPS